MQIIKSYFEAENFKIFAQFEGFDFLPRGSYPTEDRVVYSTPIALYSGVNNPIRIQCLNSDQKRIDVSNVAISVGLFEPGTQNELILKPAANVDAANGIVSVTFLPSDLAPLDFGFYEVALVGANIISGNSYPIYIDDNFGNRLPTELFKGPVFAYPDPVNVTFVDQGGVGVISSQINLTSRPMNSTLATLQLQFLQPYTGNIIAQGSLVSIPANPTDFANINSVSYSNANGIIIQNVSGTYAVIQFLVDGIDPKGWGNIVVGEWIYGANIRT